MPKRSIALPTDLTLSVPHKRRRVAPTARYVLPAAGVTAGAAATVAVAAWQEIEHRRVEFADLQEVPVRVEALAELKHDRESLDLIEAGLRREWGHFGLLGFETIDDMLSQAGRSVFIALLLEGDRFLPKAALQTTTLDIGGDPEALHQTYRDFEELTSAAAMHAASRRHGPGPPSLAAREGDDRVGPVRGLPGWAWPPPSAPATSSELSPAAAARPSPTSWRELSRSSPGACAPVTPGLEGIPCVASPDPASASSSACGAAIAK